MDDNIPLNRNQQLMLDYVEKNPGCEFGDLIKYMHSQDIFWRSWYPDDYAFLQSRKLISRVVTPYSKPTVPELNLGTITLFPELSIVSTNLKAEPLSNDARVALAFIRDHPGNTNAEIAKGLGFDEERVSQAVRALWSHELIVRHMRVRNRTPTMASGVAVFYPK